METKTFELPTHPRRGKQKIVVEKPSKDSVWYLVIDKEKAIPLPCLSNPKTPKQVLEVLEDQIGEDGVAQFVIDGFSRI